LTKNEIQIGGEAIENLFVSMVLRKKKLLKNKSKKTQFHASLLGSGLNKCQLQLMKSKVVLPNQLQ
jgi:hypothetical protein